MIANFRTTYFTPEEFIDARIENVKNAAVNYPDRIPKWHNQPHYVELWSEKDAMVGTFRSYLKGMDVGIMPNRGNTSWSALADFRDRVYEQVIFGGKKVHLLYYGDFDPSGDFMVDDLKRRLDMIPLHKVMDRNADPERRRPSVLDVISFEYIAVTEQVHLDLPSEIDEETRRKLEGHYRSDGTWKKPDPQLERFIAKYDRLYANELDSLPALEHTEQIFRKMVTDSVTKYYDPSVYQKLLDDCSPEDARRYMKQKVRLLADEFEAEDY